MIKRSFFSTKEEIFDYIIQKKTKLFFYMEFPDDLRNISLDLFQELFDIGEGRGTVETNYIAGGKYLPQIVEYNGRKFKITSSTSFFSQLSQQYLEIELA